MKGYIVYTVPAGHIYMVTMVFFLEQAAYQACEKGKAGEKGKVNVTYKLQQAVYSPVVFVAQTLHTFITETKIDIF